MSSTNKLRTVPSLKDQLQWIKIHDYSPLKTKLTDKYLVKQWVADRIDEEIAKLYILKEQGDPQAIQKLDILGTQTKGSSIDLRFTNNISRRASRHRLSCQNPLA